MKHKLFKKQFQQIHPKGIYRVLGFMTLEKARIFLSDELNCNVQWCLFRGKGNMFGNSFFDFELMRKD